MRPFQAPPLNQKIRSQILEIEEWLKCRPSQAPIYVEIGCGVGLHPIQFAKKNSDKYLLAFERTPEKFAKASQRYLNNGSPKNLKLINGDFSFFFEGLFLNAKTPQIEGVFILYPNPYPKRKNLRLAHMPLFFSIFDALSETATITVATNIANYADELERALQSSPNITIQSSQVISPLAPPRSHFEKKYLSRGDLCQELIVTKSKPWSGYTLAI